MTMPDLSDSDKEAKGRRVYNLLYAAKRLHRARASGEVFLSVDSGMDYSHTSDARSILSNFDDAAHDLTWDEIETVARC